MYRVYIYNLQKVYPEYDRFIAKSQCLKKEKVKAQGIIKFTPKTQLGHFWRSYRDPIPKAKMGSIKEFVDFKNQIELKYMDKLHLLKPNNEYCNNVLDNTVDLSNKDPNTVESEESGVNQT